MTSKSFPQFRMKI